MALQTEVERKTLQDYPGLMEDGHPIAAKSAFSYVSTKREHNRPKLNAFNSVKPVS